MTDALTLPWHRRPEGGEYAEVTLTLDGKDVMTLWWRVTEVRRDRWMLVHRVDGLPFTEEYLVKDADYFHRMRDAKANADAVTRRLLVKVLPSWMKEES